MSGLTEAYPESTGDESGKGDVRDFLIADDESLVTESELKKVTNKLYEAIYEQGETAYTFAERCKGFFDLAGGLLKINNLAGDSDVLREECRRLLRVHEKICEDYLKETGDNE